MNSFAVFAVLTLVTTGVFAQTSKPKKPAINTEKNIKLTYASATWNQSGTKIDSAFIFLKDAKSNRIVKIILEETEPDSSVFTGNFGLNLGSNEGITPEVYIPPQNLRSDENAVKQFSSLLNQGKIKRMPIVFRKTPNGIQALDVFDTKDQANRAVEAYKQELKAARDQVAVSAKPVASDSELAAAEMAKKAAEAQKIAELAAQRETDRIRLEQIEKQRMEERRKALEAMKAEEIAKRKKRASELADQAMDQYRAGNFKDAEDLFRQATEFDPENKNFYYSFGVALYKNEKFNESIVILNLAQGADVNPYEKQYYLALSYYRLKETSRAIDHFEEARKAKDDVIAPAAAFYEGALFFEQKNWEKAKEAFEVTLDTSKDSKLDEQAENYIELIARMQAFEEEAKKKFIVSGLLGVQYDSNVLLQPDSGTTTATNKEGIRLMGNLGLEYRPLYTVHHDWSSKLSYTELYTTDDDLAKADPRILTVTLPYGYKGVFLGKGYKMDLIPGYENLMMDPTGAEGTKSTILTSLFLTNNHTFVMSDDWFAQYSLEVRSDDSSLADSIGINDSSAMKYTLKTTQTLFIDNEKKRAIGGDLGYTMNAAKGDNKKFNKLDLGAQYIKPIMKDISWNLRLSVYLQNFPDETESRKDTNVGLSTGITKQWKEWLAWTMSASYNNNDSNVESSNYNKFTVMTGLVFSEKF